MYRSVTPVILVSIFAVAGCAGPLQETATPSAAKEASATAPVADTSGASAADELVCTSETPTGSKIPKRVCRTRAEMEQDREQAEELVRRGQNVPRDPRQ